MKTAEAANTATAAIVGRWQVDDLHEAHKALISEVMRNHTKVIIFIGVSPIPGSRTNPLDYPTRARMILEHYPTAIPLPIEDNHSDEAWSENLNALIRTVAPIGDVILYGGRDSFISHYRGNHRTVELDVLRYQSGTERRTHIGREVRGGPDFRAGVIYSTQNQYPRTFSVVDMAVVQEDYVLLCKKNKERGWRFPGGFIDPTDKAAEVAASREVQEETGLILPPNRLEYLGTFPIPDWRLKEGDAMISLFFLGKCEGNCSAKAADDIVEVEWFALDKLRELPWVSNHAALFERLLEYTGRNN